MNNIKEYINSDIAVTTLTQSAFTLQEQKELKKQLMSLVLTNPMLERCEPKSLLNVAIQIKALGLPMGTDRAYVIPYGKQAQLQIGYKGYIEKAVSSGAYKTLNVTDVREGELVGKDRLTGEIEFNWIDNDVERNKLGKVGYIANFQMTNGFSKQFYMSSTELHNHFVEYSKSYDAKNYKFKGGANLDAMCKKTVIKLLLGKYGILDTTLSTMRKIDSATISDDGEPVYIDNAKLSDTTNNNHQHKEIRNLDNINEDGQEVKTNQSFNNWNTPNEREQSREQTPPTQPEIEAMKFGNVEEDDNFDTNNSYGQEEIKLTPKTNASGYTPSEKQMYVLKGKGKLTDEEISQMDSQQVRDKIGEIYGN